MDVTTERNAMFEIHPQDIDLPPTHALDITWSVSAALGKS
jgi:hypothetical protein